MKHMQASTNTRDDQPRPQGRTFAATMRTQNLSSTQSHGNAGQSSSAMSSVVNANVIPIRPTPSFGGTVTHPDASDISKTYSAVGATGTGTTHSAAHMNYSTTCTTPASTSHFDAMDMIKATARAHALGTQIHVELENLQRLKKKVVQNPSMLLLNKVPMPPANNHASVNVASDSIIDTCADETHCDIPGTKQKATSAPPTMSHSSMPSSGHMMNIASPLSTLAAAAYSAVRLTTAPPGARATPVPLAPTTTTTMNGATSRRIPSKMGNGIAMPHNSTLSQRHTNHLEKKQTQKKPPQPSSVQQMSSSASRSSAQSPSSTERSSDQPPPNKKRKVNVFNLLEVADNLDFAVRPRPKRDNSGTIHIAEGHSLKITSDMKYLMMLYAIEMGCYPDNHSQHSVGESDKVDDNRTSVSADANSTNVNNRLTKKFKTRIYEASSRIVCYDYGLSKPFGTSTLNKAFETFRKLKYSGTVQIFETRHKDRGRKSYIQKIEESHPGLLRSLFFHVKDRSNEFTKYEDYRRMMVERANQTLPELDLKLSSNDLMLFFEKYPKLRPRGMPKRKRPNDDNEE